MFMWNTPGNLISLESEVCVLIYHLSVSLLSTFRSELLSVTLIFHLASIWEDNFLFMVFCFFLVENSKSLTVYYLIYARKCDIKAGHILKWINVYIVRNMNDENSDQILIFTENYIQHRTLDYWRGWMWVQKIIST